MAEKEPIRWDWIEEQWSRGALSNYQIATLHEQEFGRAVTEAAIRKRVSQYGWQRDISEAIRRQTRAKLARGAAAAGTAREEVRESSQESSRGANRELHEPRTFSSLEEEIEAEEARIIERAADALVKIEDGQRVKIARLSILADRIEAYAFAALPVDEDGTPTLQYEPGELKDVSSNANRAIMARERVIRMERKAYGMDAPAGDGADGGAPSGVITLKSLDVRVSEIRRVDDRGGDPDGGA